MTHAPAETLLRAHLEALTAHQALLEQQHLNSHAHLTAINQSLTRLTLTLEAYLNCLGFS